MVTKRLSLRGYDQEELHTITETYGQPKYRTKQLCDFLFNPLAQSWDAFSSLPASFRTCLSENYAFSSLTLTDCPKAGKADTVKYGFQTHDNKHIESVLIKSKKRRTVCVSTQVGCKWGCAFCMSGSRGFVRNLDASEIVDQVFMIAQDCGERISNIVIMGMGEPMDNYDEVVHAIHILNASWGMAIGARHITLSTVGIVSGLERFAAEGLDQIKVAISLHAPNDELRDQLMPVNKQFPLEALQQTIMKHRKAFKRYLTIEYILLHAVNDYPQQAHELAAFARTIKAKVNLIVYNDTGMSARDGKRFTGSSQERIKAFCRVLEEDGAIWTMRKSGGSTINAACGQLSCGVTA